MDGGAWWAAAYGVAQSRTRLKRLSSSSSSAFPDNASRGHLGHQQAFHLPSYPQQLQGSKWTPGLMTIDSRKE